jgi:hypothetical protein
VDFLKQIEAVGEEKLARIRAMSAYSLPINPSERGLTPEQIKARFYAPIVGQSLSVLTELGRVIEGVNGVIRTLEALLAGESVGDGEETKALEDLILLSKQKQTLREFAATLEDVQRSSGEILMAAETATKAASEALDAEEGAKEARDDILSMTVSSMPIAWNEVPSVKKTEAGGVSHLVFSIPMGRPFTIARTFSSVEEMNAGAASDGVESGQYVMVNTGDVDDEENARLYFKQDGAYHFVTDLSGATGVAPVRGIDYFTPEDYQYFDAHIDERLGEVGAALDELHSYAQNLVGGDTQ